MIGAHLALLLLLAVLKSTLGTDFDLGKAAAFDRTALYRLHVQSPAGPGTGGPTAGPGTRDPRTGRPTTGPGNGSGTGGDPRRHREQPNKQPTTGTSGSTTGAAGPPACTGANANDPACPRHGS